MYSLETRWVENQCYSSSMRIHWTHYPLTLWCEGSSLVIVTSLWPKWHRTRFDGRLNSLSDLFTSVDERVGKLGRCIVEWTNGCITGKIKFPTQLTVKSQSDSTPFVHDWELASARLRPKHLKRISLKVNDWHEWFVDCIRSMRGTTHQALMSIWCGIITRHIWIGRKSGEGCIHLKWRLGRLELQGHRDSMSNCVMELMMMVYKLSPDLDK